MWMWNYILSHYTFILLQNNTFATEYVMSPRCISRRIVAMQRWVLANVYMYNSQVLTSGSVLLASVDRLVWLCDLVDVILPRWRGSLVMLLITGLLGRNLIICIPP